MEPDLCDPSDLNPAKTFTIFFAALHLRSVYAFTSQLRGRRVYDQVNMPPMNPVDYMPGLLQVLQRLLPAPFSPDTNDAISWTRVQDDAGNEGNALAILRNLGDVLFSYDTTPDQITTDPIETAQRLAPAIDVATVTRSSYLAFTAFRS
jgi:hypothetical protein